jgi:hypothetical protein
MMALKARTILVIGYLALYGTCVLECEYSQL